MWMLRELVDVLCVCEGGSKLRTGHYSRRVVAGSMLPSPERDKSPLTRNPAPLRSAADGMQRVGGWPAEGLQRTGG